MLMRHPHPELQFTHLLPYGALVHDGGVQFILFSRSATAMRLLLYDNVDDREPADVIDFDPDTDRWGDVWSLFVPGIGHGQLYHLQADGPFAPERGHWFDGEARLIDPYARALAGCFQESRDGILRPPKCVVIEDQFDWEGDRHLRRDLAETVIYEMHVRGFTRSQTSRTRASRNLPGRHREDPVSEVPGRHGRRTDADPRVPDSGHPRPVDRTAQLLGLRSDGILRPASGLCGEHRAG